jgi:putative ABC transport system permease protein
MNLITLSLSYIWHKKLDTLLSTLILSLGVGIIVFMLLILNQFRQKFDNDRRDINLVVGAKGSPLQLILSSIYHIDFPTGNILMTDAKAIMKSRGIKKAIPLALGDSYKGFRIVGTEQMYPEHYNCKLKTGKFWKEDFEVTLGSTVAQELKLKIGDTFNGAHGLEEKGQSHQDHGYKVVGVLERNNSVIDRLILTNIGSVWVIHEKPEADSIQKSDSTLQITSILIQYQPGKTRVALDLPAKVNRQSNLQAAVPAQEMARLQDLIGIGKDVVQGFAIVIIFIAAMSIFFALLRAMQERKYDLSILRSLGAGKSKLFLQIIVEASLLTIMGSLLGILSAHIAVEMIGRSVDKNANLVLSGFVFYSQELIVLAFVLAIGLLSALVPALEVYRLDISKTLAEG